MMRKKIKLFILLLFMLAFPLNTTAKVPIARSQLEVRSIQTHYYNTNDVNKVTKATINTLQDNGFTIQNIENELGYIRAKKEFRAKRTDKKRVALYCGEYAYYGTCTVFTFGACAPYLIIPSMHMKNELSMHPVIVDSNIDIEKVGKRTKVRFIFVEKILENSDGYSYIKSSPRKVVRYYNPELYQEFFSQLDKNIFIEKI